MTDTTPPEPISAEQARALLDAAMDERLGKGWQDEGSGWLLVSANDYFARVNWIVGSKNIDFYVDLLGNVTVEENPINPVQTSGRLIAWVFLLLALGVAYLFARAVGWL
jgi:hypothetical protein